MNSLPRRLHVGDGSILAASIVSFSARSSAANHDREVPITSILVLLQSFTFFAAFRGSVRLLSDPVAARKFFSLDWSDPVMEAVS